MENSFEIKDGDLIVTVKNAKEELAKYYQRALEGCCSEVTIRGFRKGKAPLDVASKAVDPQMLNDRFTRKVIDESFKSYIKDEKVLEQIKNSTINGTVPSVDLPEPHDGSIVSFIYPVKPIVTKLADYKDIDSKVVEKKVDAKAIDAELSRLALEEAELIPTTEEAKLGDMMTIEVKGSINGIDRPELAEKSIELELGAHKFVPGFEENLKGHKEGDNVSFTVTLPSNYPEGLADKEALFSVKVLGVKEKKVPQIDDEFATVQSTYNDATDLSSLKEKISEKLSKDYATTYRNQKYSVLIQKVMDASEFAIDEKNLKNAIVSIQKRQDEEQVSKQGLDLLTYLKLVGMSEETYENNVYANNLAQLKAAAIAEAIRSGEKMKAPNAKLLAQVAKERFGVDDFAKLKEDMAKSFKEHNPSSSEDQVNEFVADRLEPITKQAELDQVVEFVIANNK